MIFYSRMKPRSREKLAVLLLTTFLLGWITVSLAITAVQIDHYGYGSGITDRRHLPVEVKERFGMPSATTPQELMEATSR